MRWMLILFFNLWASFARADETPQGLSPQQSLTQFRLADSLRIELVASEPQVIDPVAISFDEQNRLWVVEMRDYPNGPESGQPPNSRISILTDADGDGFYETSKVFAENLLFATGLQLWEGGAIVTVAGQVIYLKDTTGDGKADLKEVWFEGFAKENPQLRANHPTLGPDHQIYIANGLRGGSIRCVTDRWGKPDEKPLSISGRDFKFDPHTGKFSAISGVGQFGLTFDEQGNRFVCSNRNPCKHIILEDALLKRNPHLVVKEVGHDVSPAGAESKVFPITKAWTTSNLHAGQFTAACGVTIFRGHALGDAYVGNSFTCEPTGSLVHRDILTPHGSTFTSRPGQEGVEFLASLDSWFRPVNLAHGPDGALYIVDMYRAVIEHPQWMPPELRNRPDMRWGDQRGRIYRVVSKSAAKPEPFRFPGWTQPARLVKLLSHENAWHRDTAARVLLERSPKSVVPRLREIVHHHQSVPAQIHVLRLLHSFNELRPQDLMEGLTDTKPGTRESALRVALRFQEKNVVLSATVSQLLGDPDGGIRFQAALYQGPHVASQTLLPLRLHLLLGKGTDSWQQLALLSSLSNEQAELFHPPLLQAVLKQLAERNDPPTNSEQKLVREMGTLVGSRLDESELRELLSEFIAPAKHNKPSLQTISVYTSLLQGIGEGARRKRQSLQKFVTQPERKDLAAGVDRLSELILLEIQQESHNLSLRRELIVSCREMSWEKVQPVLSSLISPETDPELRTVALTVLSQFSQPEATALMLSQLPQSTPRIRQLIVTALLRSEARTKLLLDAIEAKSVTPRELSPLEVNRLISHRNASIKQRSRTLLKSVIPASRKDVVERYQESLKLKADPIRGKVLFAKSCSGCHRVNNVGKPVGPDISDLRTKQPAALLLDILDPNRAIDNNYVSYTVATSDGETHNGIIAVETATSVTLKQAEGKTVSVLRSEIEFIRSQGISLMPVGVEKNLDPQQMADLIGYLKNWRYLDGTIPGQNPGTD